MVRFYNHVNARPSEIPKYIPAEAVERSKVLKLKIGCKVLMTMNSTGDNPDVQFCTGQVGIVVGFKETRKEFFPVIPVILFNDGRQFPVSTLQLTCHVRDVDMYYVVEQIPMIIAYGATVHRVQGLSLHNLRIDFSRYFADGQHYTSLSRATTLEGLELVNFDHTKIKNNSAVQKFYQNFLN